MTKANWELAPHDAETYEQFGATSLKYCKPGYCWEANTWVPKAAGNWTILEHRPRIIAREDMKEGMVVRCVRSSGPYEFKVGREYTVGPDDCGDFGPLDGEGHAPPARGREDYTFELVSEAVRLDPNSWDVLIDSPESEGEEWTHMYGGDKCYIILDKPDVDGCIVVVTKVSGYVACSPNMLEPIKPTITKAEAEERLGCYIKD